MQKIVYRLVAPVVMLLMIMQSFCFVSYAASSVKLDKLTVVSSEKLGEPIQNTQVTANTIQKDSNGDHIFYGLSNNTLFAYNLDTEEMEYTKKVGGSNTLDMGSDGVLNIASGTTLYRFDTATKKLESTSGISYAPDTGVMHKGAFDSKGNYYFGTYPNAALYQYNVSQKKLVKIGQNILSGEYIRAVASCGDYIFMGGLGYTENNVNHPAELKVYDASTGTISTVTPPIWEEKGVVEGEVSKYYSMSSAGKYLFARFACYTAKTSWVMGVYDSEQKKWVDFRLGTSHLHASDMDEDGYIYMRAEGTHGKRTFVGYNPETKDIVDYDAFSFYTDYLINPSVVELKNQTKYPGKTVIFGASGKGIAIFNLQSGEYEFIVDPLPKESDSMRTIKGGPDNEILISSMAGTQMILYDGTTKTVKQDLPIAQKESIQYIDGDYYVGSYGEQGAIQKVNLSTGSLQAVANMSGHHQGRAFVLEDAGEYIIWGTIPDYGYRGGAVGIYNKSDKTTRVYSKYAGYEGGAYPSFFESQSISGLTYLDGYVYGSTTMFCGLGITPTTSVSTVFKMDVTDGSIVKQNTLSLTTDTNPQYYAGGMTVSSDGRIFVAGVQTLIELDPATLAIKKEMRLGSLVQTPDTDRWQPFALEWGENGLLYTNIGNVISAVDVDTWESKTLLSQRTSMLTLGTDGNVYYMSHSNLALSRINLKGADWVEAHAQADVYTITINGEQLDHVSKDQLAYAVVCPAGTTTATVDATVSPGATRKITQTGTSLPFHTVISVTSKDGSRTREYTIYFFDDESEYAPTVTAMNVFSDTDGTDQYTLHITDPATNPVYHIYIYQDEKPATPTISNCTNKIVDITKYLTDLSAEYTISIATVTNGYAVLSSVNTTVNANFGGGSGIQGDPYLIYNLRQLQNVSKYPSAYFTQQRNITSSLTTPLAEFSGNYNGNGYSVALAIQQTTDYAGLFQKLNGATVSDVVVKGSVAARAYLGGITGLATNSTITGCINNASVAAAGNYSGGIAGSLASTPVTQCVNYGAVTSNGWYAGGITGGQTGNTSVVKQCANYGNVSGKYVIGGIVGYSYVGIQECFNHGDITATNTGAGGILGQGRGSVTYLDCYNAGTVTGPNAVAIGRLSGHANTKLIITNCYNIGKIINDLNTEDMGATSADVTGQTVVITNSYYISETGYNDQQEGSTLVTLAELEKVSLSDHYTKDTSKSRYPILKNILPTETVILNAVTIQSTGKGTVNVTGTRYLRDNETLQLEIKPQANHIIASVNMNGVDIFTNSLETLSYTVPVLRADAVINITFAPYSSGNQIVTTPTAFQQATDPRFVVFATVSEGNWSLQKYGVVISATQQMPQLGQADCTECIAYGNKNSKGQFGIAFSGAGLLDKDAYYVRSYAVYLDSDNQPQILYGETIKIVMK